MALLQSTVKYLDCDSSGSKLALILDGEAGGKAISRKSAQLMSLCLPLGIRGPEEAVKQMVRA